MPTQPSPEDQFRNAYKQLADEVGGADALQALDDLHSDAHAAATFGQPLFEDETVDGHEYDEDERRLVEEVDGVLVNSDGDNVSQRIIGEVSVVDMDEGRLVLDGDTYDAKDHIKAIDYKHREFDGDRKVWLVDEGKIGELHENLNGAGFLFTDARDEVEEDDGPSAEERLRAIIDDVSEGDRVEVEYEQKNGNGTNSKEGEVRETRLPEEEEFQDIPVLRFMRDDGQRMFVRPDDYGKLGLFTAMSHAPFVGDVEEVLIVGEVEA